MIFIYNLRDDVRVKNNKIKWKTNYFLKFVFLESDKNHLLMVDSIEFGLFCGELSQCGGSFRITKTEVSTLLRYSEKVFWYRGRYYALTSNHYCR